MTNHVASASDSSCRALSAPQEFYDTDRQRDLLAALFDEYADLMKHVAFSILNSTQDAEDIVHEVFCILLTKGTQTLAPLSPREQRRYLLTAAHNCSLNHLRHATRELLCLDDESNSEFYLHPDLREDDFTQELCRKCDIALLQKVLASLRQSDREVLCNFYFSKKTLAQQARESGCSAAAMRQHLCRARIRCRKKLMSEQKN